MAEQGKPRRNPFRGFVDLMSEMNRAQEQWMLKGKSPTGGQGRSEATAYVPPSDIFADGEDLVVRCEVPGVKREDVSVTVSGGALTITGQRHSELENREVVYYTRERVYGEFRRTMLLPEGVDEDNIIAHVRNGLLEITLKRGAAARVQNVNVEGEDDE